MGQALSGIAKMWLEGVMVNSHPGGKLCERALLPIYTKRKKRSLVLCWRIIL